jgi:hypothetical protein
MNEKNSLLLVLCLTLASVAMLLVAAPLVGEMAYARAAAGQGGRAITTVRCSATGCTASTATGPTGGGGGNGGGPGGGSGGAGGIGTSTGVVSPPCEVRACQPPPVVIPPPVIPPTRGGGGLGSGGLAR